MAYGKKKTKVKPPTGTNPELEKRAKLKFALEGNHGSTGSTFKAAPAGYSAGAKLYDMDT